MIKKQIKFCPYLLLFYFFLCFGATILNLSEKRMKGTIPLFLELLSIYTVIVLLPYYYPITLLAYKFRVTF